MLNLRWNVKFEPNMYFFLFRFDVHTLDFIEVFDPQLSSTTSSAHWRKEPGTNNLLNFHIKGVPGN